MQHLGFDYDAIVKQWKLAQELLTEVESNEQMSEDLELQSSESSEEELPDFTTGKLPLILHWITQHFYFVHRRRNNLLIIKPYQI